MLQPKEFRYTLIVRGIDEHPLLNAPIGWEDQEIKWARSAEFYGMVRSFTIPLRFVTNGAYILRKEFYTYGMAANVQLRIEQFQNKTWLYETVYLGEIDFGQTFKDAYTDVTCNVMQGGISKMVNAYKNVKYEIDIDGDEAIEILVPALNLQESATFIFLAPIDNDPKAQAFTGLQLVANEVKSREISAQSVEFEQNSTPNWSTSDKWFYKANVETELVIENGRVKGAVVVFPGAGSRTFSIQIVNSSGVLVQNIYSVTTSALVTPFDQTFSLSYQIDAGEKLFMYLNMSGSVYASTGIQIQEGEMRLTYDTKTEDTITKALRPAYVFEQLIKKMNDNVAYPCQSYIFNSWVQLCITSGDALRQLEGSKIKTSFNEFFQSINSQLNIGFGIENGKAVLESKEYWTRPNLQTMNIDEIKDFNLELYEPYLYSSIKVGYADQNYDELNGRSEFNSQQDYSTPINRLQKELNLVSPYRADTYGIEYLRINLENKESTDASSDNDVFFIKVKSNPESGQSYYRPEGVEAYSSVFGIDSGNTTYNLDLSPKKMLLRHGDFLHGMLDKFEGYQIKFQSASKNADLVTTDLFGLIVAEKSNIEISSLPNKLFLPYMVTVTTKLPINAMKLLDAFPTGYVRFTYKNFEYTGFMIECSVDISKNGEREFKLLLTPNNNLLNLVN